MRLFRELKWFFGFKRGEMKFDDKVRSGRFITAILGVQFSDLKRKNSG